MFGSWMGPVGLAMAAMGGGVFWVGFKALADSLRSLPEPLARAADASLGRLERGAIVIVVAVAIYLVGRQLGHGRAGLYVCMALLMVNAATMAALRVRWVDALDLEPAIATRHRQGALLQMIGAWIGFAGCAIYLLRP